MTTEVRPARRVRPGEPGWPSEVDWEALRREVGGRLIAVESPLAACRSAPSSAACAEAIQTLANPHAIGDHPALTQTSGWLDAWTTQPSVYAVAARRAQDVVAAVNFARRHHLRLVVKGGGHSYKGTSCSADSLLIWTRAMDDVVLHDAFVPEGCDGILAPQPAVSIGAGAMWGRVYDAVTTRAGRYAQGGGCTTVGVAGLIQSGGFGSFSKTYGLAAAGLLEAEVVTADGRVRVVNATADPELFWALKGGGGGTFGVVTRLTLRTRELPERFGGAMGTINARSDAAYRRLVVRILALYRERLFNPHWGEQIRFEPRNRIRIGMVFQGLTQGQADEEWRPLREWVAAQPEDLAWEVPLRIVGVPARHFWDTAFLAANASEVIAADNRPDARAGDFVWAGNLDEAGQFFRAYQSLWLPASLLEGDQRERLAEALVAGSRQWGISLHFNKGLAGAPDAERAAALDTATNPAVVDAFALAVIAANGPPAFPDIPGLGLGTEAARREAEAVERATEELRRVAPASGAYLSESDFFQRDWRAAFWGPNYPRLAAVKRRYDPTGLFFVHQGVGSEGWSADGFTSA